MRVVFLTNQYPRWSGDRSGAALGTLARALMRRGISVRVVAPSDEQTGDAELDGVPVHRVRSNSDFCNSGTESEHLHAAMRSPAGWGSLFAVWRKLKMAASREVAAGADLVHAHWWVPAGLAAPSGVPIVLTVSSSDASLLRRSRVARSLARRLFRRAAVVTTISREVGGWVESGTGRHVSQEHIHPLPIDTRGHPWTRGGAGALVMGTLVPASRVELAIQTAAVLAACGHDMPLTIVGEGPDRGFLEQRAAELGIPSLVKFAGGASAEEVRRILERSDLMLFTSRSDGTALAALEALSSGIPVIACWDGGAAVDIVPASGAGRLCLPSPEALADSVLELYADPDRMALARLVGESWRARLAPEHVATLCEGWYRDALAG